MKLKYKPAVLMGGKNLVYDCGRGLFGKKFLSAKLNGITNDSKDPSVDTFPVNNSSNAEMLWNRLDLKIDIQGSSPQNGGEVILAGPIVQNSLSVSP
ncbi:probable RNA 3'-terminal phosphate cyclase-like protein [Macadamia integrifolia]|uniref:probable RNA 3'-terminal phosphate cyclase-like protein n=1 Tax=Macadamia integrifolia TaxID=60698 RepID=UPI001C4EA176|nr:probable RNA 3'-terminal phosphate cyclase-like protein [Macadamia integrifolia]